MILNQSHLGATAAQSYAQIQGVEIRRTESGEERLTVVVESSQNVAALLQSQSGVVQAKYKDLWQVDLPLDSLEPVASAAAVSFVRLPQVARLADPLPSFSPQSLGQSSAPAAQTVPIVSQGVPLIGAQDLHDQGITGQGVKVGIIDLGFAAVRETIDAGELPPEVVLWNCLGSDQPPQGCEQVGPDELGAASGNQVHGTAVAEIVHDVAPDAELHLYLINTEVELGVAFQQALDEGVQVINHSVGWFNDGFYNGRGVTGRVVRDALQNGVLWVNAAGNFAQDHYEGTFQDADGDGFHDEVLTLDARQMGPEESFFVFFTWDAWPETTEDFDLFLERGNKIVASSVNPQNGTEPVERLNFALGSEANADIYQLRIQWVGQGPPPTDRRLELFVSAPANLKLSPVIQRSSLPEPSNAPGAFDAGAISVAQWTEGVPEFFSSQGPTNDGVTKPDLAAPDCVRTFAFRHLPSKAICGADGMFPGTSAAAPHVAGAVALLWSQDPDLTPEDVEEALKKRAQPVAGLNPNRVGAGRLEVSSVSVRGPDLVITQVTSTPEAPQVGQRAMLSVQVKNQGEEPSGPFWVAAWLKSEVLQTNQELSSRRVSRGIPPGATQEVQLSLTISEGLLEKAKNAQLPLVVVVDAFDDVEEKEESNNLFELSLSLHQPRPPELQVDPSRLSFQAQSPQDAPRSQPLTISNGGEEALSWTATTGAPWLQLDREAGKLEGGAKVEVEVSVNPSGLSPGSHQAVISVAAQGSNGGPVQNSPTRVQVTLELAPPPAELSVSPSELEFQAEEGGTNPAAQPLTVKNKGGQPLQWQASESVPWLSLDRAGGTLAPGAETSIQVRVEVAGQLEGTYSGKITISAPDAQGSPVQVAVSLTVTKAAPKLGVSPTSLSFSVAAGAGNPAGQVLAIRNDGQGVVEWEATSEEGWILPGVNGGTLQAGKTYDLPVFIVNIQGFSAGTYTGTLTISAPGVSGSPVQVEVTLTITGA